MATLDILKERLREEAGECIREALSDQQHSDGFNILLQGSEQKEYQDFIIPPLSQLLAPFFHSAFEVSVLEIGPGPKSVLRSLPSNLRRKIIKYAAFEPNKVFASTLEQ